MYTHLNTNDWLMINNSVGWATPQNKGQEVIQNAINSKTAIAKKYDVNSSIDLVLWADCSNKAGLIEHLPHDSKYDHGTLFRDIYFIDITSSTCLKLNKR